MKKVITAQDIQEARKGGQTAIAVPPGALITPQAQDDARSYGIALQREHAVPVAKQTAAVGLPAQPAILARPAHAPAVPPEFLQGQRDLAAGAGPFTARETLAVRNLMAAMPVAPAAINAPAPAPATMPAEFVTELISRQVAQHLGSTKDMPRINAVVRDVLNEQGIFAPAAQPVISGAPQAPVPQQNGSGAVLVRGRDALLNKNAAACAVIVADSLIPDAQGPGVGYLQFADSSFDWTFNADEVLVVLEGELHISGAGLDLKAGPGDAVRLMAGLSCTLTATGRVSCVYSAWPK